VTGKRDFKRACGRPAGKEFGRISRQKKATGSMHDVGRITGYDGSHAACLAGWQILLSCRNREMSGSIGRA
jgi:hypothetical protein